MQVMEAELDRAMSSLGSSAPSTPKPDPKAQPQPKPYFISYAVTDVESVGISAQFGALTGDERKPSPHGRRAGAPRQPRLRTTPTATTATARLTTMPLPLTDDRAALARCLWFATNRGYGRALDSYLKVKTEQQVRAKEEDASADFSKEPPVSATVPVDAKFSAAPR